MNRKDISVLSFKVLSIYALIKAIDKLTDIIYFLFQEDQIVSINFAMISLPLVLLFICSLLLWCFSQQLYLHIFKREDSAKGNPVSFSHIQTITYSAIGIGVLAFGLPELINIVLILLSSSTANGGIKLLINTLIVLTLKCFIGLILIFKAQSITNCLGKS